MLKFIKKLIYIIKNYDRDQKILIQRIVSLEQLIREHTVANIDVHRDGSYIIVIGEYQGHDYVNTFHVRHDDFPSLVDHLKNLNQHYRIGRVDSPPQFRAVIDHLF